MMVNVCKLIFYNIILFFITLFILLYLFLSFINIQQIHYKINVTILYKIVLMNILKNIDYKINNFLKCSQSILIMFLILYLINIIRIFISIFNIKYM